MRDKIIEMFDNIKVPNDFDNRIYNNTIYKNNNNNKICIKKKILKPSIAIILITLFLSVGVMAKDYIKNYVFNIEKSDKKVQTTYSLNGFVEVNNNFECSDELTLAHAYEKLGINALNFGEYNDLKIDYCEILRDKENNIRKVVLKTPRIFSKEGLKLPKNLFVSLEFLTKYATNDDIQKMQNVKWVSISTNDEGKIIAEPAIEMEENKSYYKMPLHKSYDKEFVSFIENKIANSDRYIWYNGRWLHFSEDGDLLYPVEGLIDYYCEVVKGYYVV